MDGSSLLCDGSGASAGRTEPTGHWNHQEASTLPGPAPKLDRLKGWFGGNCVNREPTCRLLVWLELPHSMVASG